MRDVGALLQTAFDESVRRLQEANVQVPERQYITGGNAVAYDSEQFTVNLNRIAGGRPGGEDPYQFTTFHTYFAEIQFTLIRTTPVMGARGRIPSTDAENAASQVFFDDMQALTEVLTDMANDGVLTPGFKVPCAVGPTLPYGPSGGVVGSVAVVSVQLV